VRNKISRVVRRFRGERGHHETVIAASLIILDDGKNFGDAPGGEQTQCEIGAVIRKCGIWPGRLNARATGPEPPAR
jgi:hypothetical protein